MVKFQLCYNTDLQEAWHLESTGENWWSVRTIGKLSFSLKLLHFAKIVQEVIEECSVHLPQVIRGSSGKDVDIWTQTFFKFSSKKICTCSAALGVRERQSIILQWTVCPHTSHTALTRCLLDSVVKAELTLKDIHSCGVFVSCCILSKLHKKR